MSITFQGQQQRLSPFLVTYQHRSLSFINVSELTRPHARSRCRPNLPPRNKSLLRPARVGPPGSLAGLVVKVPTRSSRVTRRYVVVPGWYYSESRALTAWYQRSTTSGDKSSEPSKKAKTASSKNNGISSSNDKANGTSAVDEKKDDTVKSKAAEEKKEEAPASAKPAKPSSSKTLQLGDTLPKIKLENEEGGEVDVSTLKGVVIFLYPKVLPPSPLPPSYFHRSLRHTAHRCPPSLHSLYAR